MAKNNRHYLEINGEEYYYEIGNIFVFIFNADGVPCSEHLIDEISEDGIIKDEDIAAII